MFFTVCSNSLLAEKKFEKPVIQFSYWNDNILSNNLFGIINIPEGDDDHFTASFLFNVSCDYDSSTYNSLIYLNVITDKHEMFRTDLLSFLITKSGIIKQRRFTLGVGYISNGNFGGDNIQNSYHKGFGHAEVKVPYSEEDLDAYSILIKSRRLFYDKRPFRMSEFFQLCYQTEIIPTNLRFGVDLYTMSFALLDKYSFSFQSQIGYVTYFQSSYLLDESFESGLYWGASLSFEILYSMNLDFWITNNQHGIQQQHFGMSVSYPLVLGRLDCMDDYIYP